MANNHGYIGRAPGDSTVIIARQQYTPGGIQTDFTFDSGYTVGYVDAYINGVRQIEGTDYTASDGSAVGFTSYLVSGDTLELVAYKAFNIGNVEEATGNFTVGGDLTVQGDTTLSAGTSVAYATTAFALENSPDVSVNNITGVAATFTGNVTIGGSLIYEDVTNVDSWGIVTGRQGFKAGAPTAVGATIDPGGTAQFAGIVTAASFSGNVTGNATGLSGQPSIDVEAIIVNSGIVTVTTFDGNLTGNVTGDLTGEVNAPAFDTNVAGVVVTGVSTATSGFAIGIQSSGTTILSHTKTLNFVGTGNTLVDRGSGQIDISLGGSSSGGGGGEIDITSSLFV